MASKTTIKCSDGKPRYIVNYREPDGRQRRKTFRRSADADAFAATVEADKLRGTYVDPVAGKVTFQRYAEQWLAAQTSDVTSREGVERALRLHVFPVLGSKQLRQVKPSTVQAWLRGLTMSPTYQRAILGHVSSILSAAVDDDLLTKNPCRAASVRPPKLDPRQVVPWPTERVAAVHGSLPEPCRVAATIAAGLGLRQGEVFGLSPDDVDFLRGVVKVRRQVRLFSDGSKAFRSPKGRKERTVPLPSSVRDALAAHLAAYPAQAVTLGWDTAEGAPTTVDLVLTTPEGEPLDRSRFNRCVWAPALADAKVEAGRDNGMHALRHFFASVLLDAGESIKAVSEYLGHSDPGFTLRTYTHLMPSSAERTRQAVDAALSCYTEVTSVSG